MLTINRIKPMNNGRQLIKGACLSADTKPTEYANGSTLFEMDTATCFMYDEENQHWHAITNDTIAAILLSER